MKIIPLTQGKVAIVDDADYERVSPYNWYAVYNHGTRSFYAVRTIRQGTFRTTVIMHRMILGAPKGVPVDHENHDTLDNRRDNLRLTTSQGNNKNVRLRHDNSSGVCGVAWCHRAKKWRAYVMANGKNVYLGRFTEKQDAIAARQAANLKYGFHANHGREFRR